MNKGIIYLIQPAELINTNRYKIGCTKTPNLERCYKGYKKGSRYICIMECIDPLILENKIKEIFNDKFKLIAGNEYYEGDENEMYKLFIETINKYRHLDEENDNENDNEDDSENENDSDDDLEEIKNIFNNYYDDILFGGNKKLVKINIDNINEQNYNHFKIKIIYIYKNHL